VAKKLLSLVFIFTVGGIGGVFFERFGIPRIAQTSLGRHFPALKAASQFTTIVNKTEVLQIEESEAIPDLADRVKNSVVFVEVEKKSPHAANQTRTLSAAKITAPELYAGLALTNDGFVLVNADLDNPSVSSIAFVADGKKYPADVVSSDTSTGFVLLHSPEKRYEVLPFKDEMPRLGSRLFELSASKIGEIITPSFEANILSAVAGSYFSVSQPVKGNSVIVDFQGNVVGMSVEGADGQNKIVGAADLKNISDELLRSKP
jgi:S1-C subfamily serine protease